VTKRICAAIVFFSLALPCGRLHAEPAERQNGGFVTFKMEYLFRQLHAKHRRHKAMAANANGALTWTWRHKTPQLALKEALRNCNAKKTQLGANDATPTPCFPLALDGDLLVKGTMADGDWQKPAPGEDMPLLKGRKHLVRTGASRGVLLYVHGCSGLGGSLRSDAWGNFINALGYDLYAPDSFADDRPAPACGKETNYPPMQISAIRRQRVAQTLRTLEILKKQNPGKPIYLWGHSEGGHIVQVTGADVSGIIVTGEECGAYRAGIAASGKIPVLYIFGDKDPHVNFVAKPFNAKAADRYCRSVLGTRKFDLIVLKDRGHLTWPWNSAVANAFAKFLGAEAKPLQPAPRYRGAKTTGKMAAALARYAAGRQHKAFASSLIGSWALQQKWDNAEDAAQAALFRCAKSMTPTYNIFETGRHLCGIVSVDGKTSDTPPIR
jgi:pimeloyl-ACP methyl ester carboxylesterase